MTADQHHTLPPERLARYCWAAELVGKRRVLDAACGRGWGTALLAGAAAQVVGVDLSPTAISAARQAYGECAEFIEGDLLELPFGDDEFDGVVCFEVLAHTSEHGPLLDELRRVLQPGGLLLVSAPNRDVYPQGNPLHRSEISSGELESLLGERFANLALYRQQTYFASLLCDDDTLAHDNLATPIEAQVRKSGGGAAGSELYAVAIASDAELPEAPAQLTLGEDVDYAEQRRLLEEWQRRAIEAEAEAEALRRKLGARQG